MFLPFPSSYLNITLFFYFRETQQDVTVILMETNAANGKKKVWIHGSGNSHLTKHETQDKWRETDAVEVRSTDENRGGENEDEEEEERKKKPFISCFAKMNFKAHLLRVMLLFAAKKPPINTDSALRGQQANIVRYVDTNRESGW